MKISKAHRFETLAVHAGHGVDPATGAVTEPIHLSTTFERGADGVYPHGYLYSRNHNPNRNGLEAALAAPEEEATNLASFARGLFAPLGGVVLELPTREPAREPPDFNSRPGEVSQAASSGPKTPAGTGRR